MFAPHTNFQIVKQLEKKKFDLFDNHRLLHCKWSKTAKIIFQKIAWITGMDVSKKRLREIPFLTIWIFFVNQVLFLLRLILG